MLIAMLTAMAAFENMNVNEHRKQARDEYKDYLQYRNCLSQRFHYLLQIHKHIKNTNKQDNYSRTFVVPQILIPPICDSIEFSKLSFLSKASGKADKLEAMQCFDLNFVIQLESNFQSIQGLLKARDKIFENPKFIKIIESKYQGDGCSSVLGNDFRESFGYLTFSNFLLHGESLLETTDKTLWIINELVKELNLKWELVLDKAIADENGGFKRMNLPIPYIDDENQTPLKYNKLTKDEQAKLNFKDYPN